MQFFAVLIFCIIAVQLEFALGRQVDEASMKSKEQQRDTLINLLLPSKEMPRTKRSSRYVISDCISVTSEEGRYYFKSYEDSNTVCGIYFLTDPDKVIEIHFEYVDVPCETGGLIGIVDGWELDGEYFPSVGEHRRPFEDRYYEFCGMKHIKERKTVLTSQNAGLVQYRIPKRGYAFTFSIRFLKTNSPCNILNEGKTDVYTLRNYGKSSNCSFIALSPSKVKILAMNVGVVGPLSPFEVETGSLHKCSKRGMTDVVLVGGNEGLDTLRMTPALDTCGLDSVPQKYDIIVACNMTTVKLISSGESDNSVTFMISPVEQEDLLESAVICGL